MLISVRPILKTTDSARAAGRFGFAACRAAEAPDAAFADWLGREKRLLLHAGGQSRRLPAYAASGKSLTPIPVFRWARGQRIDQTLLDLQVPLYEKMLERRQAISIHS